MKRSILAILILSIGLFTAGCPTHTVKPPPKATLGFVAAVEKINANNRLLTTLWARHNFDAVVVDDKRKAHEVVGDGALLYRSPRGLLIRGNRPLAPPLFEIGSTDEKYWLKVEPELQTMWWGSYSNLGKPCVDTRMMPIRPDLVVDVLGIGTVDTDFLRPPAPTMRFNPDQNRYMFIWNARLSDRYWAQREVWYDLDLRPVKVILYDEDGRVLLRANLSAHKAVEIKDLAQDQWPRVATKYQLFFPPSGTKMSFELEDVQLDKNGVPSKRGIVFPAEPGVPHVVQIDEGCNDR